MAYCDLNQGLLCCGSFLLGIQKMFNMLGCAAFLKSKRLCSTALNQETKYHKLHHFTCICLRKLAIFLKIFWMICFRKMAIVQRVYKIQMTETVKLVQVLNKLQQIVHIRPSSYVRPTTLWPEFRIVVHILWGIFAF